MCEEDHFVEMPFTVVVDTNEGAPFRFRNLYTFSKGRKNDPIIITRNRKAAPLIVPIVERALWAEGGADYTIDGMENEIQIELKHSVEDLFNSVGRRRVNFEKEIARLNENTRYSLVVITATWQQIRDGVQQSSVRPQAVVNTILGWQIRFPFVHWLIVPDRNLAEYITLQSLELYHRKYQCEK